MAIKRTVEKLTVEQIVTLLDEYADAVADLTARQAAYTSARAHILTPVKEELAALDAENNFVQDMGRLEKLKARIKAAAETLGESVGGVEFRVDVTPGKSVCNKDRLDGLVSGWAAAAKDPGILEAYEACWTTGPNTSRFVAR